MAYLQKKQYYTDTGRLAGPIILSLAGQALVQMIDNIMVGQLGAPQLAAVALAGTIILNLYAVGIGVAISLTPLAGKNFIVGRFRETAALFQNSLSLNTLVSLALAVLLLGLFPFLSMMGQPEEVIALSHGYYILVTLSLIPTIIFLSFKQFLEALGNTKTAMIITLSCNLLNVAGNYMFIFGKWGAPELGVTGAGLSTLLSRLMMPIVFYIYTRRSYPYKRFFRFFGWKQLSLRRHFELLRVGFPIAGQMVLEYSALTGIAIMMGWVGTVALAANQVVMSLVTFTFMVSNGIAGAATILVSHQYGLRNAARIRHYGYAAMQLSVVFMFFFALIFAFFGTQIASVFTPDRAVVELAGKLFIVVALFELLDGLQVTALGALRGITDVNRPMLYSVFSYWIVCLPVGYLFGFVLGLGAVGVFSGFSVGLLVACLLFIRRFRNSVRKLAVN